MREDPKVQYLLDSIQKDLNVIKKTFLTREFDDRLHGWIVEDHIYAIQDALNQWRNREFKKSEPDPFA